MTGILRRRFTDEFKIKAVFVAESLGLSEAARELVLSRKRLGNWVRLARGQAPGADDRPAGNELERELARLRLENASLRLEHEIFRRLVNYLTRHA